MLESYCKFALQPKKLQSRHHLPVSTLCSICVRTASERRQNTRRQSMLRQHLHTCICGYRRHAATSSGSPQATDKGRVPPVLPLWRWTGGQFWKVSRCERLQHLATENYLSCVSISHEYVHDSWLLAYDNGEEAKMLRSQSLRSSNFFAWGNCIAISIP